MFLFQGKTPQLYSSFSTVARALKTSAVLDEYYIFCIIHPGQEATHQIAVKVTAGFAGEKYLSGFIVKFQPNLEVRMNPMCQFMTGQSWDTWIHKNGEDISTLYEDRVTREGAKIGYVNIETIIAQETDPAVFQ